MPSPEQYYTFDSSYHLQQLHAKMIVKRSHLATYKPKLARLKNYLQLNLHYLRVDVNKLSYAKLEALVKLPINTLMRAELGKQEPNYRSLCKLAAIYGISVSELIGVDLRHKTELAIVAAAKKAEREAKLAAKLNR